MAEETFKQIVEVEVNNDDAIQAVVEQQKAIDGLRSTISDLKKQQKELDTTTKEGAKAYDENAKMIVVNEAQLKTLNQTMNANKRIVEANNAGTNEQTGAYQRLSQEYTALAQKAKDMAVVYGTNSQETIKAQQEAKNLSDRLKEIDNSVGQNQRNVGNYTESINLLTGKFSSLPNSLGAVKEGFSAVGGALKGLIVQALAFIATPVGAVIAAVAAAAAILYSVFKDFKPIVDKIEQSMEALGAVFDVVKNTIIGLFTGQKSLSESTKGLGSAMAGAAKQAANLKKAQQELEDAEGALEIQNKRSETQMQKLLLQSKNRTLSEKERMKMLSDAQKIETDIHNRKLAQNNAEVANAEMALKIKLGLSKAEFQRLKREGVAYAEKMQDSRTSAEEEIKTLTAALLKREDISQESIAIQEKAQNRSDALEDAAKEKKEKAAEDAKRKREQADEEARRKSEAEKQRKIKEQDKMFADMELKQKMYNATNRELTAETAKANFKFETELLDKKLKLGTITQEEYDLFFLESKNKYQDATLKIAEAGIAKEKELAEKVKNQEAIDFANKLELAKGNLDLEYQLKAEQREKQRKAEIADVKKLNNDLLQLNEQKRLLEIQKAEGDKLQILAINQKYDAINKQNAESNANSEFLINEKYRQEELQAEQAKNDAKIAMYSQAFGALASIAGKNTELSKGFASAQIAIDTYVGAIKAFNSVAGQPIIGAILAGAVVVKGAKAIKDVWKVKNGQKSISSGGGGGGNVNVSQGMAQRNAREMPSEAIQRTQKTEPTIVPVLVTNNLTEKIDTKVQVTNNASM